MTTVNRIIVFIDLLGTKESHKISDVSFEEHMEIFLKHVLINASILDERYDKINHFSDCTFIFVESDAKNIFRYLNLLRDQLLNHELYFKGGLAFSGGQAYDENAVEERVFSSIEDKTCNKIKKICTYTLFGPDVVPAYLKHEILKGVGYYVDENISNKYPDFCINSVFVSDKHANPYIPFKDIKYKGRLVEVVFDIDETEKTRREEDRNYAIEYDCFLKELFNGTNDPKIRSLDGKAKVIFKTSQDNDEIRIQFDKIVRSIRRAYIKDKNYPRYYLSLVISIIRSSIFDYIWYDKYENQWRNYPYIFRSLIIDKLYKQTFRKIKNYEITLMCLVSEVLLALDYRRYKLLEKAPKHIENLAKEQGLIPKGYKKNITSSQNQESTILDNLSNTLENLVVCRDAEEKIIRDFIGLRGSNVAGELRNIPDFIMKPDHKMRIECEYSMHDFK